MRKSLKFLFYSLSVVILFFFVLFVATQTNQAVELASKISPMVGTVTLYTLLGIYSLILLTPVYIYVTLPSPLSPPGPDADQQEIQNYVNKAGKRLSQNDHLGEISPDSMDDIKKTLGKLEDEADEEIRQMALTVFVTTAISQSGRLDGISVLVSQAKMVWKVAHIYKQRPSFLEMLNLYRNVAVTAFLAVQMEEMPVEEMVEPIVEEVIGTSAIEAIPGASNIGTIFTDCVLDGSANAFLTLRVGAIAKKFCDPLTAKDKSYIRRSASGEAAGMLHSVIVEGSGFVLQQLIFSLPDIGKKKAKNIADSILGTSKKGTKVVSDILKSGVETGANVSKQGASTISDLTGTSTKYASEASKSTLDALKNLGDGTADYWDHLKNQVVSSDEAGDDE